MDDVGGRHQEMDAAYEHLFREVAGLLLRHDPVGINFTTNIDEYEPEARTIIPRLRDAATVTDARRIVYEEFVHWFGARIAGNQSTYQAIAEEIWSLWIASPVSTAVPHSRGRLD